MSVDFFSPENLNPVEKDYYQDPNLEITAWCGERQSPLNKTLKRRDGKREEKIQKDEVKLSHSRCHIA